MFGPEESIGSGHAIAKLPKDGVAIRLHHLQQEHSITGRFLVYWKEIEVSLVLCQAGVAPFVGHFDTNLLTFWAIRSCSHGAYQGRLRTVHREVKGATTGLQELPIEVPHHISRTRFTGIFYQVLSTQSQRR